VSHQNPVTAPRAGVEWGLYEEGRYAALSARLPGSDDRHDFVPRRPSVLGPDTERVSGIVSIVSHFRTRHCKPQRRRRLHTRGLRCLAGGWRRPESVAWVLPRYLGPLMAKILVLVIEDNLELRELFADVLMNAGHDVITASDGSIGLALCAQHRPALVITDLELPGFHGLTVVERLSQEPGLKIIAVSGSGLENLERARRLGAAVTLEKPFHLTQLLAAVRQLVGE
jgi:CheY-like chemotaxis protein